MTFIKTTISSILFLLFALTYITSNGQSTKGHIPFYAVPYYNYDPLSITIGKYKKELLTNDTLELMILADKIRADINNTDIESLFFLSIRLYDLGKKDDAFYWFHTAKARAIIFVDMLEPKKIGSIGDKPFELKQFFISTSQIVGEYLNGFGFNDIDKGIAVIEKVKSEIKNIQSYKEVYKDIHFVNDEKLESEKNEGEERLTKLIDYIRSHKEEIKKQRIDNGTQDKY